MKLKGPEVPAVNRPLQILHESDAGGAGFDMAAHPFAAFRFQFAVKVIGQVGKDFAARGRTAGGCSLLRHGFGACFQASRHVLAHQQPGAMQAHPHGTGLQGQNLCHQRRVQLFRPLATVL